MANSNAFTEAKTALEDVEGLIASVPNSRLPIFGRLKREILITGGFLLSGIVETLDSYLRWILVSALILIAGVSLISGNDPFASPLSIYLFTAAFFLPMLLTLFAVPSIYVTAKIRDEDIQSARDLLISRDLASARKIELLRRNIRLFEGRARSRLRTLKWAVASVWALFLFLGSKYLEINIAANNRVAPESLINALWIILFITISVHLSVAGYERSINKLFLLIELSCDEIDMSAMKGRGSNRVRRNKEVSDAR